MRKKTYPANLLQALHLNERLGTDLDYNCLTADQRQGLEYQLSLLTEREQCLILHCYRNGESKRTVALKFHTTENRVDQIIRRGLQRYTADCWLLYVLQGYEGRVSILKALTAKEELAYCNAHHITDYAHLYYQPVEDLHLSVRINHALTRAGIHTVRETLLLLQSDYALLRIRNLGTLSISQIKDRLIQEHLLSAEAVPFTIKGSMPLLDFTYLAFCRLNCTEPSDFIR